MSESSEWLEGIEGNFRVHRSVIDAMPKGTKVTLAESWGISAWTKTAKVAVVLPDGSAKRYFLKVKFSTSCVQEDGNGGSFLCLL